MNAFPFGSNVAGSPLNPAPSGSSSGSPSLQLGHGLPPTSSFAEGASSSWASGTPAVSMKEEEDGAYLPPVPPMPDFSRRTQLINECLLAVFLVHLTL